MTNDAGGLPDRLLDRAFGLFPLFGDRLLRVVKLRPEAFGLGGEPG